MRLNVCYFIWWGPSLYHHDALLCRINERLELDIDPDRCADIDEINKRIKKKQKILSLRNRLNSQKKSWYWYLNKIRNIGTHTALINIHISVNVGSVELPRIRLKVQSDQMLEIIPYLEKCIENMKELIQYTLDQDPLLRWL